MTTFFFGSQKEFRYRYTIGKANPITFGICIPDEAVNLAVGESMTINGKKAFQRVVHFNVGFRDADARNRWNKKYLSGIIELLDAGESDFKKENKTILDGITGSDIIDMAKDYFLSKNKCDSLDKFLEEGKKGEEKVFPLPLFRYTLDLTNVKKPELTAEGLGIKVVSDGKGGGTGTLGVQKFAIPDKGIEGLRDDLRNWPTK